MHVLQAVAGLQVCIYAECAVEATNYCFVQLITQDDEVLPLHFVESREIWPKYAFLALPRLQ